MSRFGTLTAESPLYGYRRGDERNHQYHATHARFVTANGNGSNSQSERTAIQEEVTALNDELNRIAETTSFGGKKLLNGSFGSSSFQIGGSSGEAVQIGLKNMRTDDINMGAGYVANGMASDSWEDQTRPERYYDVVYRPFWSTTRDHHQRESGR